MYLLTTFSKWSFSSSSPETELGEGRPSSPRLNHCDGGRVGWGGVEARKEVLGGGEQLYCIVRGRQMRDEKEAQLQTPRHAPLWSRFATYCMHRVSPPSAVAHLDSSMMSLFNPPTTVIGEIMH